ncbi:MAG: EamA family transporter RarD [Spirochaetales bacterium]|jgi:chloramphenicol-sensitive protein RarD
MNKDRKKAETSRAGTFAAFAAYGMWGAFPIYWKLLSSVEPFQILAHRIIWAGVFCFVLMAMKGRLLEIATLARNGKRLLAVILSSAVVTANWGLYIWAVNTGRITESALGYYINPLLSIAFGVLFFKEKADRWTRIAVAVAVASILGAAVVYGSVPWISLILAFTFAVYGALKKFLGFEPLLGLTAETLAAAPFALIFLIERQSAGLGSFWNAGLASTILLMLAGVATAIPLLLFAAAANSISLQKMGFIQYVSPSCMLFLGIVVFGEKPSSALLLAFAGVIFSVLLYVFTRKRVEAG